MENDTLDDLTRFKIEGALLLPQATRLRPATREQQWKMEDARLAETEEALPEEAHAILDTFNELYGKYFKTCEGAKVFHPIKFTGNVASSREIQLSRKHWQLVANFGQKIQTRKENIATALAIGVYPCYDSLKINVKITSIWEDIEMKDVTFEEEEVKGINGAYFLLEDIV